ncbi:MAG: hypothetical protein F9K38_01990 [Pseudorhodoplanes sp.]|nr:MAG: hypothetical protein F9K38_01990 [Pseudorhodoplanes sp.]
MLRAGACAHAIPEDWPCPVSSPSFFVFALPASAECSWDETRTKCSKEELDIKLRSLEGYEIALLGVPLGYGEWFMGCAGAPLVDVRNCVSEKGRELYNKGREWVGGIRMEVRPVGTQKDLKGLKNEVLRLRDRNY